MKRISGLRIPHSKNTAGCVPEMIPVPPEVRIPLKMHGGTRSKLVVKVGDIVKVGQIIGEADGKVSSPVHSSVSGTVKSIIDVDSAMGHKALSVVIATDGEQTLHESVAPHPVTNLEQFLNAVQNSGAVGLGGAGYPTAPKLTMKESVKLDYLLINGAECEPYITSDTRTMIDDAEYVVEGAKMMMEYIKPKNLLICIEENKPEPIRIMKTLTAGLDGIDVHVLPSRYPQGERKVLVYNVTNRIVPEGGRLTDVGCTVINCATVAVFAKYIKTGLPLISRIVTVDGSAVNTPKNVIAPIGSPIGALFEYCGGLKEDYKKILVGGPMMGLAVPDLDMPVVKITNALLALMEKEAKQPPPTACIKCGRCVSKCPMRLMPCNIENAYELRRVDLLRKYKVNLCAECGCCAYLCPSKRPLAHVMEMSMKLLREARKK